MEINRMAIASFHALIAEDEINVYRSLKGYLEDQFYKINIFHGNSVVNCRSIVQSLAENDVFLDLAILDFGLVDETSNVFCCEIRDYVPIIHYTGYPKELDVVAVDEHMKEKHPQDRQFGLPSHDAVLVDKNDDDWVRQIADLTRPIYQMKINERILNSVQLLGEASCASKRTPESRRIGRIASSSLTGFMNTLHRDIADVWPILTDKVKAAVHDRFGVETDPKDGQITRLKLFKNE